jgi:glycosyl transferase family 25
MDLLQNTLFINLDHRTDRLTHIQEEFSKLNITAERVPAVQMRMGNVGCTMSHMKCLQMAKERQWSQVFICEDDITFTDPAIFINSLSQFHLKTAGWDVLIIGGNNCPPYQKIDDFHVQVFNVQTTTGYIVKSHYYDTLIENFKEGLGKLIREPEKKTLFSLDIYWKSLQTKDKWFMITPLTVIQYNDYSDIEERVVDYKHLMLDLDKTELLQRWLKYQKQRSHTLNFST